MSTVLADTLHVARRFTRAVRVDDRAAPDALAGYVCSQSIVDALLLMGRHLTANGHGAFTWTGPYGSGKSSLGVALSVFCGGEPKAGERLLRDVPEADRAELQKFFRPTKRAWRVAAAVGRRDDPELVLGEALAASGGRAFVRKPGETIAGWATRIAAAPDSSGLVLLVDEMGKFLEHAARAGGDVHVFQELAEAAARAEGRLVVVGILHQAFDEYAHRLAREARDEWLKVQGRFIDIPINLAADEQLELLGRAIEGPKPAVADAARQVAGFLQGARFGDPGVLAARLAACWPLHPVVAALLGPISRRRFGQNQRSLFGFLNSAEPHGFQAYLQETPAEAASPYPVARLWDYLHVNLEPAILASPDGHRWSTALEALARAEAKGALPAHLNLLKTIALIDLFKDRSGLQASPEILATTVDPAEDLEGLLSSLKTWSVAIYRSHVGAYAIYAGSDFDIEAAAEEARRGGVVVDYRQLARHASLQPVLAKRHYETTGALRWFEVELTPLHEAEERVRAYRPAPGAAGLFLLAVSARAEEKHEARAALDRALALAGERLVVCGWTRDSYMIREMASDLAALEQVRATRPELEGDAIARREVDARIARLAVDLEDRLAEAISAVDWRLPASAPSKLAAGLRGPAGLSVLASRLSDWRYPQAPKLPNELLNRTRPSSNAAAAVRALLHAMVDRGSQARLGFDQFPPEAGLYVSLLEATGLHQRLDTGRWAFAPPEPKDAAGLHALWAATDELLQSAADGVRISQVFDLWRGPPFGLRDGLLTTLITAYLLTRAERSAVYLDGIFRPSFDTFVVDRLLQDPASVSVRAVELSDVDVAFIGAMAERLSTAETAVAPTALEVARALVGAVRALPNWSLRTGRLPAAALRLRDRVKPSDDPNRLLLDDLPSVVEAPTGSISGEAMARRVGEALHHLQDAYPAMLRELEDVLLRELRVKGRDEPHLAPLRRRAGVILGLTGNFRLDALATRLTTYSGALEELEAIASLAANKPPRDWVDRDVDASRVELAALAQQFLRAEGFARLKGREDGRVSVAIYVSDPSYPEPQAREADISAAERALADGLAQRFAEIIRAQGVSPDVALAALASLGLGLKEEQDAVRPNVEKALK